jgi:hypothetical protein
LCEEFQVGEPEPALHVQVNGVMEAARDDQPVQASELESAIGDGPLDGFGLRTAARCGRGPY